ncbi:MAG: alkaline phosphatase D family protein [Planctomycetota bacterium]|nr:alkaline phosphatase D family protein [Planctomycetota bacterium]
MHKTPFAIAAFLWLLVSCPVPAASFQADWAEAPDRPWVGPDCWANRLQDWRIRDGRLECTETRYLSMRTVHLLTHRLGDRSGGFGTTVRTGLLNSASSPPAGDAMTGFLVGVGGAEMDHRAAAIVHGISGRGAGVFAGIAANGTLMLFDNEWPPPSARDLGPDAARLGDDVRLELRAEPLTAGMYRLKLTARDSRTGRIIGRQEMPVPADRLVGNVALVSHPGTKAEGRGAGRFWFRDWSLAGGKVEHHPDRALGPILSTQHTLSRGVLKLTAQMMPLGQDDETSARLQLQTRDGWVTVDEADILPAAFTATFRVDQWDDTRDHRFRVVYGLRTRRGPPVPCSWEGTVRRDPADKPEIVLAAFTGNHNNAHGLAVRGRTADLSRRADWITGMWFPHDDVAAHVAEHEPDVLFFSGDQVYEGASPTFADRRHIMRDYLYKWYLWCWAYRDLTRDIPAVTIPDDHDVYQGNLWGHGGRRARTQNAGGYVHAPEFVNMVQRTQTSHLPDPVDPAPVEQGIGVYFTELNYGRISFAVLEDRKFKSGCTDDRLPATGTNRTDHFNDPDFDTRRLDLPHLTLLGARQLDFLERWAADWRGADMKAALSQTVFANLATHHGANLRYLVADLDSNGWPQSGRERAIRVLRKAFAVHVCGDQHLATVARHGLDHHRDAIWSFCVPSVANFYPRQWLPPVEGSNRPEGAPGWAGDHLDGFRNRVTVRACTNPRETGREPAVLHDRMPGYGIVRFDKVERTITFECWPRFADPRDASTGGQYEGWPITIHQLDNDGRKPAGYLPIIDARGAGNPVVQVVDESNDEIVYALRVPGAEFQPKVFRPGLYTIRVGDPDAGPLRVFEGIRSMPSPDEAGRLRIIVGGD